MKYNNHAWLNGITDKANSAPPKLVLGIHLKWKAREPGIAVDVGRRIPVSNDLLLDGLCQNGSQAARLEWDYRADWFRLMSPKNWLQPSLVTLVLVRFPSPSLNSHHSVCHRGQLLCKTEEKLSFSSMISIYLGYFIVARHVWWHQRVQNFSRRVSSWLRMIRWLRLW